MKKNEILQNIVEILNFIAEDHIDMMKNNIKDKMSIYELLNIIISSKKLENFKDIKYSTLQLKREHFFMVRNDKNDGVDIITRKAIMTKEDLGELYIQEKL
ncbi:TPA: hypothetical protein R4762_001617 [Campylobacter jejuni]|nr:hypothetical protein [Campylobacter jejuni]